MYVICSKISCTHTHIIMKFNGKNLSFKSISFAYPKKFFNYINLYFYSSVHEKWRIDLMEQKFPVWCLWEVLGENLSLVSIIFLWHQYSLAHVAPVSLCLRTNCSLLHSQILLIHWSHSNRSQ